MTTKRNNNAGLLDVIETLDPAAQVPAYRALVHSSMARCIGALRQHIRSTKRTERMEEEEALANSLDQRNGHDENERAASEIRNYLGFDDPFDPLETACNLHAVYDWTDGALKTITTSPWDTPLDVKQMLSFMISKSQPLSPSLAMAMAEAAECDVKDVIELHELQDQREREQLTESAPEILSHFESFGENGYRDALDSMPKVEQHQFGVKILEGLYKAKERVLTRVMRSRRISDLGSISLIKEGIEALREWITNFETAHRDEIREAMERGRTLRTADDIAV